MADPDFVLLHMETPEGRDLRGRVVFVAGKRIGNAVFRNRAKRVLRAAIARRGGLWAGLDVALIAKRGAATARPEHLDAALARFSKKHSGGPG
jgi:ribonuclease P protein component